MCPPGYISQRVVKSCLGCGRLKNDGDAKNIERVPKIMVDIVAKRRPTPPPPLSLRLGAVLHLLNQ